MTKSFKIDTILARALLVGACLLCLTMIFFFIRWCLAVTVAARAPAKEVAEWSIELSPQAPQTHYSVAVLAEKNFSPTEIARSLAEYERAASLAPHDYRLWLALGRARERDGDQAGAELALRKSLELAPNYTEVQWTLGNALLRSGKTAEAFAHLTEAADANPNYRSPTVNTAWQVFDGDLPTVRQFLGDSHNINFALVSFLAKRKLFAEAVQIWNDLPNEDKKTVYRADGEQLFGEMLAAKKYRAALQIQRSLGEKPDGENFALGKIFNGGFETPLAREKASVFDWQIAPGEQPQIGPNNEQKHGGDTSLFMIFNSPTGKDFRAVSQTVPLEPKKNYTFEFFYKAELKAANTLRWEVVDAVDGKVLASVEPILSQTDWRGASKEFATSATTEAVIVQLVRESCQAVICPIAGKVWFDDFQFK